jgi:hypothetical protein
VKRLDESRILWLIAEGFAQFLDCAVQAVVKVNEGIGGP